MPSAKAVKSALRVRAAGPNVHIVSDKYYAGYERWVLLISDLHWDNPHCDRELLKRHLDEAVERDAVILINGDLFCLMQGRYDPRRGAKDVRPEHVADNYLDAVVNDAVEWFKPYAKHIAVVGYGNHEAKIVKHQEFDPIGWFVKLLNYETGGKSPIYAGAYSGWIVFQFEHEAGGRARTYRMKYHHGYGGGGPVTKGAIQFNRLATYIDADFIWMGHVHEDGDQVYVREHLTSGPSYEPQLREVHMIRTSTYKEEYSGGKGWHTERGAAPKPLGGRWIRFYQRSDGPTSTDIFFDMMRAK